MGTGGSRYGAGRPGWRRKTGSCLSLDVRELARRGQLAPGVRTSQRWQWSHSGEESGAIQTLAGLEYPDAARTSFGAAPWTPGLADHVRLIYSRGDERFDYAVWLERTPQRFGGWRYWWLCPRCGQRRAVLYGVAADGKFGCRGKHPARPQHPCMDLAYSVEAEDAMGRAWRKIRKLQARIGDDDDAPRYVKPKGMHWRTFNALCDRIEAAEQAKDEAWLAGAAALLGRYGWPPK